MIADPNNERAEFAVMVRSDWHGRGLGFKLMHTLITCADRRAIGTLYGDVLRENTTMLDDVGYGQLGCYGGPIETPNLSRFLQSAQRLVQRRRGSNEIHQ